MSSSSIASSLMNMGQSRPTLYSLQLPFLSGVQGDYLELFCSNIQLPGISHETITVLGQENLGVQRDQPIAVRFGGPMQFDVIESSDFAMYKAFRNRFDLSALGSNSADSSRRIQRMNYYDNYKFDFQLKKLEYDVPRRLSLTEIEQLRLTHGYRAVQTYSFVNAYLTSISPIGLQSSAVDSYLTFTVQLNYESYSTV